METSNRYTGKYPKLTVTKLRIPYHRQYYKISSGPSSNNHETQSLSDLRLTRIGLALYSSTVKGNLARETHNLKMIPQPNLQNNRANRPTATNPTKVSPVNLLLIPATWQETRTPSRIFCLSRSKPSAISRLRSNSLLKDSLEKKKKKKKKKLQKV